MKRTLLFLAVVSVSLLRASAQDCVGLYTCGPDESITYLSGCSCAQLRATQILDPTKDEVSLQPLEAARRASKFLRDKHPKLYKDWSLDSVGLKRYDFPEGSRWYYVVQYLTLPKNSPRPRLRSLLIVVLMDGTVGHLKPKPKE